MSEKKSKIELSSLPFMDSSLELEKRVEDLLERLTLQEKFMLSSGQKWWYTKPIGRLGIKEFAMHDGPHGVRVDREGKIKTTYFPSTICRAATWNTELSNKFGIAIAQEIRDIGAHMLLAPGINIQRTPMCGRTFEYQSEDPYLNKKLAVAVVKGVQSQRVAACIKHFICNNQETNRFTSSSEVSERALHEIYYPAFKAAVQKADAWSIMSCYNKVNGIYGSENEHLLREVLMSEWGFRGFVVTDWGAGSRTTSAESCINAGLTLEMPAASIYNIFRLSEAYKEGKFTEEALNDNIRRLLRVMFLVGLFDNENALPKGSRNTPEHQALACEIAEEGIVLLKNERNILPIDKKKVKKIAVIGPNANKKTYLGGGSSSNFPPYEIKPIVGIEEKCKDKVEIINSPSEADITVIFAGLTHQEGMDREGVDKVSFSLPEDQISLITETIEENPNTVVVLTGGSPISMINWIDKVPAVVQAWYGGMEAGNAIANILFGDVNPSGKLPITFPKELSDSPAHVSERTYPGDENLHVFYDEGIFVGYRHFDTKNIEPQFPFGHGLSYTTFTYNNLNISNEKVSGDGKLDITVDITNSGERLGAEVVQLYIQDVKSSIERPLKELKGFKKVKLKPNKTETIKFEITKEDLSFYDENNNRWKAEKGLFNILIGSSSRDIRLQGKIEFLG
ncbi:MAG: glycoside hydrolase family 3 C-terminal domain-containing protein [Candidatus Lokiarchaeota archaeon]|nr:glycoside hydrolase family 3 C-terminal domain-containing protein [Candidatus Lokiarchaeota archaeon]